MVKGNIYHICSKSIAGYEILRADYEYERFRNLISYYKLKKPPLRFSDYNEFKHKEELRNRSAGLQEDLVSIIAYCFMPTHIHLILKQLCENGISIFMGKILNSYTRYFNIRMGRKGPLWEGRFKRIYIEGNGQFLHTTSYVHLNPVTDYIVNRPEDWRYSSYKEYLGIASEDKKICTFSEFLTMDQEKYKHFVEEQIDYQRNLAASKKEER